MSERAISKREGTSDQQQPRRLPPFDAKARAHPSIHTPISNPTTHLPIWSPSARILRPFPPHTPPLRPRRAAFAPGSLLRIRHCPASTRHWNARSHPTSLLPDAVTHPLGTAILNGGRSGRVSSRPLPGSRVRCAETHCSRKHTAARGTVTAAVPPSPSSPFTSSASGAGDHRDKKRRNTYTAPLIVSLL